MTIDPRQLLRRLEPAVRPTGNGGSKARVSVADGGFLELLSLAHDGGVESAREPILADGATLEPTTLAQIGRALDLAEGRGARRAVVVAEGRTFIADVPSRTLERLETRDDFVFEEVDAAIAIRGESATYAQRPLGPRALPPVSIAEQFESARIASARGDEVSPRRASA
jgi:hypothetical protein